MKRTLALLPLLAVLLVRPADAQQTVCPAYDPEIEASLEHLLSDPNARDWRTEDGWGHLTPADLRLLIDSQDRATCEFLRSGIELPHDGASRRWAFYKAGNFYIIKTFPNPSPDGVIRIRHTPLIVLRSDFSVVGVYTT